MNKSKEVPRYSAQEIDFVIPDKGIDARTKIKDYTILASNVGVTVTTKTEDFTVGANDSVIVVDASSGTVTITLPTAVGIGGRMYTVKCIDDTNTVTVTGDGSETIDGETAQTLNQWDSMRIVSDGENWLII